MVEVERELELELEFEYRWEGGLGREEEGEGRDCSAPILIGVIVFRRVGISCFAVGFPWGRESRRFAAGNQEEDEARLRVLLCYET